MGRRRLREGVVLLAVTAAFLGFLFYAEPVRDAVKDALSLSRHDRVLLSH